METLEQIKARIEAAVPGAKLEFLANDSPSGQRSLLADNAHALPLRNFFATTRSCDLIIAPMPRGLTGSTPS